jgi:hypothetical protein
MMFKEESWRDVRENNPLPSARKRQVNSYDDPTVFYFSISPPLMYLCRTPGIKV